MHKMRVFVTVSLAVMSLVGGDVSARTLGSTLKLPVIVAAQPTATGDAILIRGVNFPTEMPSVTLGDTKLRFSPGTRQRFWRRCRAYRQARICSRFRAARDISATT